MTRSYYCYQLRYCYRYFWDLSVGICYQLFVQSYRAGWPLEITEAGTSMITHTDQRTVSKAYKRIQAWAGLSVK